MLRRPPRATRTDTLLPYTTLFRSTVRIGCGPITADYLLPIVCALALRHAPNVSLDITIGTNYELKEAIRQERLDIIVGVISSDDEFVNQGFIDDIVVVAASQSHPIRSEEHTSELQSLMRISYAVFCLKKKKQNKK